ncbi:MAG: hypothetical protein QOI78_2015, partial [Actinomycetota bacterium]|nr:hypothetical protein [Actinomycetota bacterium]
MQFGIFGVGDPAADPATGRAPTEHERIKRMVETAVRAEEAGLDVYATGEHHHPPFVPSSPTTNDPVKIAEDGRLDLMLGRGNTGPVYPWFGK